MVGRRADQGRARYALIVIDASALVDLLLRLPAAAAIEQRLWLDGAAPAAPHLIDVETVQALRRLAAVGAMNPDRAERAFAALAAFPIRRFAHAPLLGRVWRLRHALTAYDAVYVALAEALGAPLLTSDARLGRATGHRAVIEVFER